MYISPKYRANLANYKYSGIDKSLMSKYVLGPYWSWLVERFPLWMAPNLITFIGFNICLFNLATLLYFSPDLKEPCPNWVYFTFGVGLFAYQSLDAIDGKQARRTGSGGPLGELFDHGCDALNTTIGVLLGASMFNAHQTWWLLLSLLAALANFYMSTWEEYHTGTLYLSYCSGPVEGVILVVANHIFTGFVGPRYWDQSLQSFLLPLASQGGIFSRLIHMLPDASLNHVLFVVMLMVTGLNIHGSITNVIEAKRKSKQPIVPALVGLLPFVFSAFVAYVWLCLRPEIVTQNAVVFALFIGVMFGYTVGTMITAHVTKSPFPLKPNVLMMVLMIGAINAILERVLRSAPLIDRKNEPLYLQGAFVFSLAVYLHFAIDVIRDICHFKGIYCFKLGKRESDANTAPSPKNGKIKKAQ